MLEGIEIVLTEGDTHAARLVSIVPQATTPRKAGLHTGAIWTSDDFDEPLTEFWTQSIQSSYWIPKCQMKVFGMIPFNEIA